MYCVRPSRSSAVGTYSLKALPSNGVTAVIARLIRRLGNLVGLRQFFLDSIAAHVCERDDHGLEQSEDWRPVINAGFRLGGMDHHAQVNDVVLGESRGMITFLTARFLELSVVTQFFREASRFSCRRAVYDESS